MKKINIKVKNSILFSIFLIISLFGGLVFFYQYKTIKDEVYYNIDIQNQYLTNSYNQFLKNLKHNVTVKMDILNKPNIMKNFASKNRKKLYKQLAPIYERMKKQNRYIKILTFRDTDGSVFLRVHKPKMYGDKVSKKREIILDTIKSKKRQYGFEVGKLKMTYRIVEPIFYNSKFVGVVEMGVEPSFILDNIKPIFNLQTAMFVKKSFKDVHISKKQYKVFGEYMLVDADKVFLDNITKIDIDKQDFKIQNNNKPYLIINRYFLSNHKGDKAAKIMVAYSLERYTNKLNSIKDEYILVTIILIALLLVLLNFGINYYIKQLNKSFEEIIEKDNIMIQQAKMAQMGEMIESIAHQWRQPLSVISTTVSAIELNMELGIEPSSDEILKSCKTITDSTKYASETIDVFRGFYHTDKQKQYFKISDVILTSKKLQISKFKHSNIKVLSYIDDTEIYGYRNELIQVIMNMLNNARDEFINRDIKENRVIIITIKKDQNSINIGIKDNAGGIAKENIDKVFNSRFTTKAHIDGTGIGLHMSLNIIQKSFLGDISVANEEFEYNNNIYKGACFTITIPTNTKY
jgi:signal transduction histidine kinase